MVNKRIKKQKYFKALLLLSAFVFLFTNSAFATSYEGANIVIGKNSSDKDDVYIEQNNTTLENIVKNMTEEDALTAYVYVSEYRKGDKEMEDLLVDLLRKYEPIFALNIAHYILQENYATYLTTYIVKRPTYDIEPMPIKAITTVQNNELDKVANIFWKRFKEFVPEEFYNDVDCIHIDSNKDPNNLITFCRSSLTLDHYELIVDLSLLNDINIETLYDYFMYLTVYYFVLNDDQVEQLVETRGNYKYGGFSYRTDSYINRFYKKFWKGRRFETNTNQYQYYKKEFLNEKASRTVYDDMAVSFVNYVKNGYMRRYLGFRADKTNFFDDYELFRNLAKTFRSFLGIKKLS